MASSMGRVTETRVWGAGATPLSTMMTMRGKSVDGKIAIGNRQAAYNPPAQIRAIMMSTARDWFETSLARFMIFFEMRWQSEAATPLYVRQTSGSSEQVLFGDQNPKRCRRCAPPAHSITSLLLRLLLIRCWFILSNLDLDAVSQRVIPFNHYCLAALQAGSNFHLVVGANPDGNLGLVRD